MKLGAKPDADLHSQTADPGWTLLHEALFPGPSDSNVWERPEWTDLITEIVNHDPQALQVSSHCNDTDNRLVRRVPFDGPPFFFAVQFIREAWVLDMLVNMGADVNAIVTRRYVPQGASQYTILAALLCNALPDDYPYVYAAGMVARSGPIDVEFIVDAIYSLLRHGARIDDDRYQQTVLEYACELTLAGNEDLLVILLLSSGLKNVSLAHVESLMDLYARVLVGEDVDETERERLRFVLEELETFLVNDLYPEAKRLKKRGVSGTVGHEEGDEVSDEEEEEEDTWTDDEDEWSDEEDEVRSGDEDVYAEQEEELA